MPSGSGSSVSEPAGRLKEKSPQCQWRHLPLSLSRPICAPSPSASPESDHLHGELFLGAWEPCRKLSAPLFSKSFHIYRGKQDKMRYPYFHTDTETCPFKNELQGPAHSQTITPDWNKRKLKVASEHTRWRLRMRALPCAGSGSCASQPSLGCSHQETGICVTLSFLAK